MAVESKEVVPVDEVVEEEVVLVEFCEDVEEGLWEERGLQFQ